MTNQPERIEGEHHYAEIDERSGVPMWIVCRTSDDRPIHRVSAEFWDVDSIQSSYMEPADAVANHFIQQGREEALREIDEAAVELLRWHGMFDVEEGDDEMIYVSTGFPPERKCLAVGGDFRMALQRALAAVSPNQKEAGQ